ncbi:hypothetical protein TcasGA2_TC004156 [Tribolium castaneum]|uniref:Uncharacterized protein n=1 Tax=Tribolium castaneum TaxID=7070 RepID=D6W6Q9_TRICA|nr:hypothetical protein TcasGA2_TC004156 [Tribolium castaneum]
MGQTTDMRPKLRGKFKNDIPMMHQVRVVGTYDRRRRDARYSQSTDASVLTDP